MFQSWKNEFTAKFFDARRFVFHVNAFDVTFHLSQEEFGDSALGLRALSCNYLWCLSNYSDHTFILDSSLSCNTRLNSCTSCCRKESRDFHPKDFVSSVVPAKCHACPNLFETVATHRLVGRTSADDKTPVVMPKQRFQSANHLL